MISVAQKLGDIRVDRLDHKLADAPALLLGKAVQRITMPLANAAVEKRQAGGQSKLAKG